MIRNIFQLLRIKSHLWPVFLIFFQGLGLGYNLAAQPSYEIRFTSRTHDEVCGPVVCTPEGEIFFILWIADSPNLAENNGVSKLYKIDLEGDTIRWDYQKPDTLLHYIALLYDHEGNLVLGGDAWSLDTSGSKISKFQWFCKLTTDFEILWQKAYKILTTDVYFQDLGLLHEMPNDFYLYGNTIIPDTSTSNYTYLIKIGNNGDSISFYHNNNELKFAYLKSLTLIPESTNFYIHVFRGNPPPNFSGVKYIQYDDAFNKVVEGWYTSPYYNDPFYTMNYPGGRYLSCGTYWQLIKSIEPARYIRVQQMTENFSVSDYIDLTYPDWDMPTYAAWYQCVDFIHPYRIFAGGMEDVGLSMWNPNPSWVYVACLNEYLDLIHEEYYGGDALYNTYYVKTTYDGGVILTGSIYNDSIQDYERDGFFMKFDSALFVSTQEINASNDLVKTKLYPNPGTDYLTVETSFPVLEFDLYNGQGQQLVTVTKPDQNLTLHTGHLPKGIYFWIVKFENSLCNKGKWIKY